MIRLALLRHGHTHWNRAGRIQGSSDIALDDQARTELSAQRLPSPWEAAELWSSPLLRACETAELVSNRAPRIDPALSEMNWGAWEGLRGVDLVQDPASGFRHIEDWGWDYHAPGGESPRQLWDRVQPWVARLTGDAVAVCHIGVMRVLLARAYGWDFTGTPPFQFKRNRLFLLHLDADTLTPGPDPVRLTKRDAAA